MLAIDDRFALLADHLREAVWLVDGDFDDILYLNPAFRDLVGDPTEGGESAKATILDRVHPDDRDGFRAWIESVQSDVHDATLDEEYTFDCRLDDGDATRWIETVGVPIVSDGEVQGFAGISTDVTPHVTQQRELEERVERLDQFASMVSHDLRNPVTVARGRLELYRETGDDANLDEVAGALERIEDLTTDLLTLARHGIADGDREPVGLADVARDAWDAIDTRSAELVVDAPGTVEADAGQVRALFENLFRNAVGHGGADVTVRVAGTRTGFLVEDTGSGIPEGDRDRVFEHGFTTGYGGTGVGLTIVQRIAEAHGWRVDVGEGDEGGARFTFTAA